MKDNCTYLIELRGQVCAGEINAAGPLQVEVTQVKPSSTRLALSTDQSGLVGLVSYLHGLGFVILSLKRVENS